MDTSLDIEEEIEMEETYFSMN